MKLEIFNCEQGTPEWFAARLGIPTASQFHTVMAKGRGGGESKTRDTYMNKLIGERMTGELMDNFTNQHTNRGQDLEAEARDTYAVKTETWPEPVGFLRRGRAGCSPDSLVNDDGMVEIKTKLPHLQLAVLFGEKLPPEHKAQAQGQLWIAEREWVDFVSYYPNTPPFILRVNRDEEYIAEIQIAVEAFLAEMDERMALIEKQFGKGWFAPRAPRPKVDPDKEFTDVED